MSTQFSGTASRRSVTARRLAAAVSAGALLLAGIVPAAASPGGDALASGRGLSDRMTEIVSGTYDSVAGRLQDSGYAATSLTGEYDGMYARDASIQSLAMLKAGKTDEARSILKYLIDYGTAKGLQRAPRHLPAEGYNAHAGVPTRVGDPALPIQSFMGLTDAALLKLNGPGNGGAISFAAPSSPVTKVKLGLLSKGNSGTTTVAIRAALDWNATPIAQASVNNSTFYSSTDTPSWVELTFGTGAVLNPGQTYFITMQAEDESTGSIVQLWGNQTGGSGSVLTYNFDSGNWESATDDRGAYQLFTQQGIVAGQDQTDATAALFQIQGSLRQAAQPFRSLDGELTNVWLPITSVSDEGTLNVSVRSDYAQASSQVAAGSVTLTATDGPVQWVNVPLSLDSGANVTLGSTYYLVVQADVPDESKHVVWYGANSSIAEVGSSWNYDMITYGGWHAESKSLGFDVNSSTQPPAVGPRYLATPTETLATIGGTAGASQTFTAGSTLTGLDVYVAGSAAAGADVDAIITDATGRTATANIPAADLTEDGSWHRLRFSTLGLPTQTATGNGMYKVELMAPAAAPNAIGVLGVPGASVAPGIEAQATEGVDSEVLAGTFAFQPLSLVYSGEQMTDQPDGNYMLISAWSSYIEANPDDTAFVADTYPTIKIWADNYWDESQYVNTDLQLLYDPEFEHSLRSWHIPTYDLITNVFASQALHQLSTIAADLPGQATNAATWATRSAWLTDGINENLTAEVDGKTVYAELYWVGEEHTRNHWRDGERQFKIGYSWVNLAPVAANWYGTDWDIMANTYDAYLQYGSHEWANDVDGQMDLMLKMDSIEDTDEPRENVEPQIWRRYAVIGKGLGWEYTLAAKLGRTDRLATMNHFLETHTPGDILGEFYFTQGPSDVGNQEQGSWWLIGIMNAFPPLIVGQQPTISGEAKVGETLTAVAGTWTDGAQLTYQWSAAGTPIDGAIGVTFAPDEELVGNPLTVTVTGTKDGYAPTTLESAPTAAVQAADPVDPVDPVAPVIVGAVPTIAGTARVGDRLTAAAGVWTPSGTRVTYQWQANGAAIAGATGATFTPGAAQVGKRLTVVVTGSYPQAVTVVRTSAATAAVAKGQLTSAKVTVKGKAKVGKKLRAKTKAKAWGPAPVTLTYRWFVGGKRIKGATKKALKVKKKFAGKKVRVKVTGKKTGYANKTVKATSKKIRR